MTTLLATLIANQYGVTDIHTFTTYGGGLIPRQHLGGLAINQVLNDPDAPYARDSYERAIMLITGGFAD